MRLYFAGALLIALPLLLAARSSDNLPLPASSLWVNPFATKRVPMNTASTLGYDRQPHKLILPGSPGAQLQQESRLSVCSVPLLSIPIQPSIDVGIVRMLPNATFDRNQVSPPAPPCDHKRQPERVHSLISPFSKPKR